jgi:CBS domain-containing protein
MRLHDVMTSEVPRVAPADSVRDAAERMVESRAKALPVCDGDALVGIITDWDVAKSVARNGDVTAVSVGDAMSSPALSIAPDATLDEASDVLAAHRVHHLCVSEGNHFEGMVHLDVDWALLAGDLELPQASFRAPI